ncbi:MAG: FAD binding domain-containing protein [Acidimicrobiia bacterium]|nr:FAD binding domain-containing protein [Acidimicrobiia bacterium]
MTVIAPTTLAAAVAALADDPGITVLAGGTDLMVGVNDGRHRPASVLSLRRVDGLRGWQREGDELVLGGATTYTDLLAPDLAALAPGLAMAARTVGSPQIRNTGTIGGNLATASPAGDTLPVLVALGAEVVLVSHRGERRMPVEQFLTGPKRSALDPDELVAEVRLPAADGPQEYLKIGVRNAMVIAVASCALVVRRTERTVRCVLGAVGPVPVRAPEAEAWVAGRIDWDAGRLNDGSVAAEFGSQLAAAARPIDDHRATAAYRRTAAGVLARRALERAFPAPVVP